MRKALIAGWLLVATPAIADTWADWVGDYHGKLTWDHCTAAGAREPTIPIDAVDGAMRIDLAPAGAALHALPLTTEDRAWVAQDGDLRVRVTHERPSSIDLVIDYDSGCRASGHLVRVSSGVAACDALVAWSRIEHACTKTTARLEDPTALAKRRWKPADATSCRARADRLAVAMIDAGCAPHPDPEIGTRAVACRALVDATAKLQRCGRLAPESARALADTATGLLSAAQTAEPATLPYVERQCKDLRAKLVTIAAQARCQL